MRKRELTWLSTGHLYHAIAESHFLLAKLTNDGQRVFSQGQIIPELELRYSELYRIRRSFEREIQETNILIYLLNIFKIQKKWLICANVFVHFNGR